MATKTKEKLDMQACMETYKKLATPGEPHKLLASMAGSWNAKVKGWMDPDQPPTESTGICERKMILDGRFLQEEFSGDMGGTPFHGISISGYDNHTKKYQMMWIDSMGTGMACFEGKASRDGKTMTQECHYDDPVKGPMTWRSIMRIVDNNTQEVEMFGIYKGGKEEKMMEITYTRKK